MIRTTIIRTCDRCQAVMDGPREMRLTVQGKDYMLDLCDNCSETFNASVGPFLAVAQRGHPRRVNHSVKLDGAPSAPVRDYDLVQLRAWASANNVTVPARGRISNRVLEQYRAWSEKPKGQA